MIDAHNDQDQINFQDFACLLIEAYVSKTRPTEKDKKEYLRDLFAGMAMQGLIERGFTEFGNKASSYANLAYEYADAMLKAREQ